MRRTQTPAATSELQFQTWRVDANGGPPQLSLRNITPFMMDGSPFSKPHNSYSSPNLLQGGPPPSRNDLPPPHVTPTRTRATLVPRKASGPTAHTSPPTQDSSEDGSPWCGAVGRATLGKSGRVIERLMADIDKLKRELNAEICKRQEVEKREELTKSTTEALLTEAANLQQSKEVDGVILKRRDRKIDELKAELEVERERRMCAEEEAKEALRQRDQILLQSRRDVGEAKDLAKHATGHAEVLEQSHKQLGNEYRQRTATFANDLERLKVDRDDERRRVKRLDIVVEQMRQELERTNTINRQMGVAFETYKEGSESQIKALREGAMAQQAADEALREETLKIMGEAKWLINIGRSTRSAESLA